MKIWALLVPEVEILLIALFIYALLSMFWNTRAMDVILGILACFGFYLLSGWLQLKVIHRLMESLANVAAVAVLIIFQPEVRLGLSRLSLKGGRTKDFSEYDKFLDSLSQVVYSLAEKHVGALIVLENHDSLQEYVTRSVVIDAKFSPELLETIFSTTTPLHDGGVVIRGDRILSAATILPLSDDQSQVSKSMGTRHRAGLGISQTTDALTVVVSEETGKVSIARDGIMTRGIKPDRFKGIIKSIFTSPQEPQKKRWNLFDKVKAWTT
jgi:uncharacterized protein (TIGR00159 family)